jgi:vitamin B12 transporter
MLILALSMLVMSFAAKHLLCYRPVLHFKRWSRKHYAILRSFPLVIKICTLNVVYTLITRGLIQVSAQEDSIHATNATYDIEEITVIGEKSSVVFPQVARMVAVIRQDEIAAAPVQSLQDLLEYLASVDIRQRGADGVQADVSIRGGSFDHTMVLINGIVISDPQTGHFNLDIPVDIDAIQRIEILSGPATRVYGSGAFTGAINIVVKPGNNNHYKAVFTGGKYGYYRFGLGTTAITGKLNNFINLGHSTSAGYAHNTDFTTDNFYYTGRYASDHNVVSLQAGYQQKEAGSNGFYSPRYPDQYEKNSTSIISLDIRTGSKIIFHSTSSWRMKQDHFMLERQRPEFYQNFHKNYVFGSQFTGQFTARHLLTTAGVDFRSENILSTNLGLDIVHPVKISGEDSLFYQKQYSRSSISWFQEHKYDFGKLSITAGYMLNWNSDYSEKPSFFPGLDINYFISDDIRTFVSINRAIRFPSFTDMFYTDPSHQGSQFLEPDHLVSMEGGIHANLKFIAASVALHKSIGKDIIDWLWSFETNRYSPVNLESYSAEGIEVSAKVPMADIIGPRSPVYYIAIGYNYLNINKSLPDSVSKYYNLKHKLVISLKHKIYGNIWAAWYLNYQDRLGSYIQFDAVEKEYFLTAYKPFFLLDGSLAWETKHLTFFTEISNLLNTRYVDAGSIDQPGRWFKAGIKMNIDISEASETDMP